MRMKRTLIVIACLLAFPVAASHIVGGEFELLHISGNQYRLNLIWYFDVVRNPNRIPEAQEPFIDVTIFRKSDDAQLRTVRLVYQAPKIRVGYTQPQCSSGEIITDKLNYSAVIVLSPQEFGDPSGYYISWERCCRNYNISNIFSQDPAQGGIAAGQTFYLEFPPVIKKGIPFINSSPRLFPPLNDYACPGKPYYVDFSGVDDDGDSLVYSLIPPLNTHNANATPGVFPRPYPNVEWLPGFGLDKIMNGSPPNPAYPDMSISHDGFIRVTPRNIGLFVFAVKIEEFRKKEKIGESRRDFQMLVTDCRVSEPPKIFGKKLNDVKFGSNSNMSVSFSASTPDDERCIVVSVSDPDAARLADNFSEFIRLKAIPLNFSGKELPELLPSPSTAIIHNNDSVEFKICFPRCPYFEGGAYQVGIIAFDDACALPLSDTIKIAVTVEPPPNAPAQFVTPNVNAILNEGDQMIWPFEARDPDGDVLVQSFRTNGFVLSTAGMKIEVTEGNGPGVLKGTLKWDAYCDIYNFTNRTSFLVTLMADDKDGCDLNEPAEMTFDLSVLLPGNADPIADTGLTPDTQETKVNGIQRRIFESLNFEVTGKDLVDNDHVTLRMAGRDFSPSAYGMSFQKVSGVGQVSSTFNWNLQCDKIDPSVKNNFELLFIAVDSTNRCKVANRDTVHVFVEARRPSNHPPSLAITSLNPNVPYNGNEMHIVLGEPIQLSMTLTDSDTSPQDKVSIDLVSSGGAAPPEGFVFTRAEGTSPQTATLSWSPDCSIFTGDVFSNDYFFRFIYLDDRCQTAIADTVQIDINIRDIVTQDFETDPSNVFTPNGDSYNEYFSMEHRVGGQLINLLPPDNCLGQFQNVRIYNRWGKSVFQSTDRNFRWDGGQEAAGVYYYFVQYTNREYKGTVSLRN